MNGTVLQDLFVLVADQQMESTFEGLLSRTQALETRSISFTVTKHPRKDAGCLHDARTFLRPFASKYGYCLVAFDHEGCGQESRSAEEIREAIVGQLSANGWQDRCEVVVIEPELEAWVWSSSRKVDDILGWSGRIPDLRTWVSERFDIGESGKPFRPKEALQAALMEVQKVPSSSLFRQMASTVSWKGCEDPSFLHLLKTLHHWFPKV